MFIVPENTGWAQWSPELYAEAIELMEKMNVLSDALFIIQKKMFLKRYLYKQNSCLIAVDYYLFRRMVYGN